MPEPTTGKNRDAVAAASSSLDQLRRSTNVGMPDVAHKPERSRKTTPTGSSTSGSLQEKSITGSAGSGRKIHQLSAPEISNNVSAPQITFVDQLKPEYQCPVCTEVLQFPVQFDQCGHRCCSACLSELLRVATRCPVDGKHVNRDKVFVDKAFQKEIDNLEVKCSHGKNGCSWTGTLKALKEHLEDCEHAIELCPRGCGMMVERKKLHAHLERDCPRRPLMCDFCQTEILFEEEKIHLNECPKYPVPCPNACKVKDLPRDQIGEHLETTCVKEKRRCPFAEGGCLFKGDKKELDKHCEKEMVDHLTQMCSVVMKQKQSIENIGKKMDGHQEKFEVAVAKIDTLDKLYGAQLLWKIENYKEKMFEAKSGAKPTIFSPPFLTSRHGYKMALSACLFGDGKFRGKYMSVFCCLCKGEYDALLSWPFSHKVTFTIIDQCQDPEENKPFLGRPVGERNASFGAQKFVELDLLKSFDYVRDDIMFIKVEVDSADIPNL